jgi:FkbM family methyltransferase
LLRHLTTFSFFSFSELWIFLLGKVFARYRDNRYRWVLEKKNKIDFLFIEGIRRMKCVGDLIRVEYIILQQNLQISLRIWGSDVFVFKQILVEKEFEEVLKLFEQTFGHRPYFIVDAGSNIGCTSIYFLTFNAKAKILAIEPSSANIRLAEQNATDNNFAKNVMFIQKALWFRNEKLAISDKFRDGLDWSIMTTPSEGGEINSVTPHETFTYLQSTVVDLFKIDIEGSEAALFSLEADLGWLDNVKMITVEIHHEVSKDEIIVERMAQRGFRVVKHAELTIGINTKYEA